MLSKDNLLSVTKPARYINHELNSIHRKANESDLKFCLGYPDIYEIGMSNTGFKIIYDILNKESGLICERVFLPWIDMEKLMREKGMPLISLESNTPLKDFDCLGVSLQTELNYTGFLNMLNLGKIPALREKRKDDYPLIIAGGPCCFNPEPLADFVDLFVIGEAEELIVELFNRLKTLKPNLRKKEFKDTLLIELSHLEGIYVPSLYNIKYFPDGRIKEIYANSANVPEKIKKVTVFNLDSAPYPKKTILPYIETVHDRIGIEIMRGCPNRCRFCQARNIYFPKRERSLETIKNLAVENINSTGYEEIALLSLSSLDHSQILDIFSTLAQIFKKQGVGISLSSLKVKSVIKELLKEFEDMHHSGLTFAPEAGSERLRRLINKQVDSELLYEIIDTVFGRGWRGVKLYFMFGLPGELTSDIDALIEMVHKIWQIKKKHLRGAGKIRLSLNSFIPKPHTAFQWLPMERNESLTAKELYLKNGLRKEGIQYSFSNRSMAFVEALLSRGDRKLSQVLLKAQEKGAKLDAWSEHFNLDVWKESLKEENIDPDFYIHRLRTTDEVFPWEHIDIGIDKSELLDDYLTFQKYLSEDPPGQTL